MKKKVTIQDIAKEAGVSVATVSYVINNRQDQSISEETKRRVWHIVNLFNYEPNVFAKNLRSPSTSKFIAFYGGDGSSLSSAEYVGILKSLRPRFDVLKYAVLFASRPYSKLDYADAIVAFNVSSSDFREIGQQNYIPLVALDCLVNDPVFFQVTTDYDKLKANADEYFGKDYSFVCIEPEDPALKEEITRTFFRTVFVSDFFELSSACRNGNIATDEKIIFEHALRQGSGVFFSEETYERKIEAVALCLQKAISREPFEEHFFKI